VQAFERMGCKVHRTNAAWDLTVQHGVATALVEVKDGEKPPSAQALTEAEARLHGRMYIVVVSHIEEAIALAYQLRKWHFAFTGGKNV
jgi:hypothetical protein